MIAGPLFWVLFLGFIGRVSSRSSNHLQAIFRPKRQLEQSVAPELSPIDTSGAMCLANCLETLSVALDAQLEGMQQSSGTINPVLYNNTKFEAFCRTYELGRKCIQECPDSKFKLTVQNGFISLDYLCVQHPNEFLHHIACFKKTHANIDQVCVPRCGDSSTVQIYQKQMEAAKSTQQYDHMKTIMAQICSYLHCHTSCQAPLLTYLCQEDDPARLMRDFAQVSMQASKSALRRSDGHYFFPEECEVVAQGQFASFSIEDLLGSNPQGIGVISSQELEPVVPLTEQATRPPTRFIPQRPEGNRNYSRFNITSGYGATNKEYTVYDTVNRKYTGNAIRYSELSLVFVIAIATVTFCFNVL